MAAVVLV